MTAMIWCVLPHHPCWDLIIMTDSSRRDQTVNLYTSRLSQVSNLRIIVWYCSICYIIHSVSVIAAPPNKDIISPEVYIRGGKGKPCTTTDKNYFCQGVWSTVRCPLSSDNAATNFTPLIIINTPASIYRVSNLNYSKVNKRWRLHNHCR